MSGQKIQVPPPLSAKDKSSFAYKTIKDRLPVIIVKTIDFLHRQRRELHKFGDIIEKPTETQLSEIEADAKDLISQLTRLRKDVETNKSISLLERASNLPTELEYFNEDLTLWNTFIETNKLEDGSLPKWFDSPWLLVECYLYRKIKDYALATRHLKLFDPFAEQKQISSRSSLPQMLTIANHLVEVDQKTRGSSNHTHPNERNEFGNFIQLALWANKADLSLSGMSSEKLKSQKLTSNIKDSLESYSENILCDNSSEVWFKVQAIKTHVRGATQISPDEPIYIDLVADNAGFELFADLALLHFLTLVFCPISLESSGIKFRIHVKRMPWYVSDTMKSDVDKLLSMITSEEQDSALKELGEKWRSFLRSGLWTLEDHMFWTLPCDFSDMPQISSDLYESLKKSNLIIFKGDLNYRKLTGDRRWHVLTPFRAAIRDFLPAPLVALRTAKADTVVGIEDINIYARINNNELPRDWMISGDFGLIQFVDPLLN